MKKFLFINDTLPNIISYYLIACFLILLPFGLLGSAVVLVLLVIHTLLTLQVKRLYLLLSKRVIIMASLYLLGLIGMLYSPDMKEAVNVAGRQLAILLFPVLLVLNPVDLNKYKIRFLIIFGLTCAAAILYLYATSLYTIHYGHLSFSSLFSLEFMNHNFSLPIQLHATYLSMYAALSLTVFLYLFQKEGSIGSRILYSICIIILLAGMIQLSSRAVFIALLLIINLIFPVFLLAGKRRIRFIAIIIILSAGALFSIYHVDSFKSRYVGELKSDLGMDTMNVEFTEPRVVRWKVELELIKRSPVIGYGSGSEKKLLKEKFLEKHLYISYARDFNSHSQYLSYLLNMGIMGLAGYLFVLCYGFSIAAKEKDIIFLGFLIIITVVSFSENILFLNKGIFFYAFFFSLFLLRDKEKIAMNTSTLLPKTGNPD